MVHHDGGGPSATGAEATTAAVEAQDGPKIAAAAAAAAEVPDGIDGSSGGKDQPILVPPEEGEDEVAITGAQKAPTNPSCEAPCASSSQAAGPVAFAHFRTRSIAAPDAPPHMHGFSVGSVVARPLVPHIVLRRNSK